MLALHSHNIPTKEDRNRERSKLHDFGTTEAEIIETHDFRVNDLFFTPEISASHYLSHFLQCNIVPGIMGRVSKQALEEIF